MRINGFLKNTRIVFLVFFLLLLSASCEWRNAMKMAERMKQQSISLPYDQGGDVSFGENDYKLVVYIDSLECSSCFVQHLFLYDNLYKSLASRCDLVMILFPSANELSKVRHMLSLENHSYPIIVDETGCFERLNPGLPSDIRFHSFLLGKDNRPLVIGDPVKYPSILRLIRKTIYNETN